MNSMTGYGRAEAKSDLGRLTIDITSVNSRFLDFSLRATRPLQPLELKIREVVTKFVSRGKVTVIVGLDESFAIDQGAGLNVKAMAAYHVQLQKVQRKLKIDSKITISDLLSLPGVAEVNGNTAGADDLDSVWKVFEPALASAFKKLTAMRKREGTSMAKDMKGILSGFPAKIKLIQDKSSGSVEYYRNRLTERIAELLDSKAVNNDRLEEEVAIFAEKSDVTEEFLRLKSHVEEFIRTTKLNEPVGKRLNFILQEMNREVNTIGSKCSDFSVTSTVIQLKEETEKLREMVQNAE